MNKCKLHQLTISKCNLSIDAFKNLKTVVSQSKYLSYLDISACNRSP